MSSPFTLTIDWLAFTLPSGSAQDTMQILGGDWTKSDTGFRGYPASWITAGAGRGVGKLGTRAPRAPLEVHVDLSAGIVAPWPIEKVRTVLQWILKQDGHLTRLDCALDDRKSCVPLSTIRQAIETGQCVTRGGPYATHFIELDPQSDSQRRDHLSRQSSESNNAAYL